MTTVVKMVFKKMLLALGFACLLLLVLSVYYKNVVMSTERTLILNGVPYISDINGVKINEGILGDVIIINMPLKKTTDYCWTTIGHTMTNNNVFYNFPIGASARGKGEFVANHILEIPDFIPYGDYNINTFYKSECEGVPGVEITIVPSLPFTVKK